MKKQIVLALLIGIVACLTFVGMVTPRVSHAIEYRLEDFVILVDEQLILKGGYELLPCEGPAGVRKSDIGSRGSAVIGGTTYTRIPKGAPAVDLCPGFPDDVAVIAKDLTRGNFSQLSHIIYDTLTNNCVTGCSGPTINEGPDKMCKNVRNDTGAIGDVDCLPDFPAFPVFSAAVGGTDFECKNTDPQPCVVPAVGTRDIIVGSTATVILSPGTYRDLSYGGHSHINFQFGTDGLFNFRRIFPTLNAAGSYQLIFDDDVSVRVKEFVRFTEYGNVNQTGAKGVTLYVEGFDGSYGGANKNTLGVVRGGASAPAAFQYQGDGVFDLCFVFVKNGTINVRGTSHGSIHPASIDHWSTAWFGNSLQEISSLQIRMSHPGEVCFEEAKECACITDFKVLTSGQDAGKLQVKGFNFSKNTVERLAIFSETATSGGPLKDVTGGNLGKDQLFADLNIISPNEFRTKNTLTSIGLPINPGEKYLLGIMAPPTGNPVSYCIFAEKLLFEP